jgi:hypothetical protein
LSTGFNGPPGFKPTTSIAATVASGVLPFRPEQRPESMWAVRELGSGHLSNHSLEAVLDQEEKEDNNTKDARAHSGLSSRQSCRRVTPRPGT